jgi:hypothetical protein
MLLLLYCTSYSWTHVKVKLDVTPISTGFNSSWRNLDWKPRERIACCNQFEKLRDTLCRASERAISLKHLAYGLNSSNPVRQEAPQQHHQSHSEPTTTTTICTAASEAVCCARYSLAGRRSYLAGHEQLGAPADPNTNPSSGELKKCR